MDDFGKFGSITPSLTTETIDLLGRSTRLTWGCLVGISSPTGPLVFFLCLCSVILPF